MHTKYRKLPLYRTRWNDIFGKPKEEPTEKIEVTSETKKELDVKEKRNG